MAARNKTSKKLPLIILLLGIIQLILLFIIPGYVSNLRTDLYSLKEYYFIPVTIFFLFVGAWILSVLQIAWGAATFIFSFSSVAKLILKLITSNRIIIVATVASWILIGIIIIMPTAISLKAPATEQLSQAQLQIYAKSIVEQSNLTIPNDWSSYAVPNNKLTIKIPPSWTATTKKISYTKSEALNIVKNTSTRIPSSIYIILYNNPNRISLEELQSIAVNYTGVLGTSTLSIYLPPDTPQFSGIIAQNPAVSAVQTNKYPYITAVAVSANSIVTISLNIYKASDWNDIRAMLSTMKIQ